MRSKLQHSAMQHIARDAMTTAATIPASLPAHPSASNIPKLTCYGQFLTESPVRSRLNQSRISNEVDSIELHAWPTDETTIRAKGERTNPTNFVDNVIQTSRQLWENPPAVCSSCGEPLRPNGAVNGFTTRPGGEFHIRRTHTFQKLASPYTGRRFSTASPRRIS